ncbi:uncharacterized protein LOC131639919 [Vicia villosa]|uniref:uncharacterized protein LOC131639919 n=1 Tax=Vicia villosa TaxID=3911 RepID=UPI00273C1DF8|nr:uncharacterized protein LOC131639919 [Vicia villosa]
MNRLWSLVVVFLLCVTCSYAVKVVDVDTICTSTKNHSFCSNLLNSKSGGNKDLVSLTQYTIDVLRANVTNTVNLINKLIAQNGGNFNLTYHYNMCLIHFDVSKGALGSVEYAEELFKMGNYLAMIPTMKSIDFNAWECLSGDTPSDPPYHDTSLLPVYADDVMLVANVVLSILSYLTQA